MRRKQRQKLSEQAVRVVALVRTHGRVKGEQALRQLGAEAIPVAEELLQYSLDEVQNAGTLDFLLPLLMTPLIYLILVAPGFDSDIWTTLIAAYFILVAVLGIPASLLWYAAGKGIARIKKRVQPIYSIQEIAVRVLADMENVSAVGPLLDVAFRLKYKLNADTIETALHGLNHLLPRLQEAEAQSLTVNQRESLYRLLVHHSDFVLHGIIPDGYLQGVPRTHWDVPLSVGTLHAYKSIGDARALACVTRLVQMKDKHTSRESRRVCEAARECLPYLQEQTEALHSRKNLLRASNAPGATPDTLLRPLTETSAANSEELLRTSFSEKQS